MAMIQLLGFPKMLIVNLTHNNFGVMVKCLADIEMYLRDSSVSSGSLDPLPVAYFHDHILQDLHALIHLGFGDQSPVGR